MPTRRRSRSSGRHINSPRNGSTRRSGSRGRSGSTRRSGSRGKLNGKNNAELPPLPLPPLALPLTPVIGNKSLTHMNYLLQEHRPHANEVRTPRGTVLANYHKKLTPEYLPEYPNSMSNSSASSTTGYAGMFNNPIRPVRTRSANRTNYNVGAYRRNIRRLQRRESF